MQLNHHFIRETMPWTASTGRFDPFEGKAESYHFNLKRNFFSSPEAEAADRLALSRRLDELQPLTQQQSQDADAILNSLRLEDELNRAVAHHTTYLELRYDSDTRETAGRTAGGELNGIANRRFAAFDWKLCPEITANTQTNGAYILPSRCKRPEGCVASGALWCCPYPKNSL
jgi:hypothetical protein